MANSPEITSLRVSIAVTAQGIGRVLGMTCFPSSNHPTVPSAICTHPTPEGQLPCSCPSKSHVCPSPQTLARDARVTHVSDVHRTAVNSQGHFTAQRGGQGIVPRTHSLTDSLWGSTEAPWLCCCSTLQCQIDQYDIFSVFKAHLYVHSWKSTVSGAAGG